ncbi:MAG: general secretion pathway protein GspK [Proteobacteria bacterium]|nr:general secretion pathway protein GspK [Pseudomonadota bacterium]
MNAAPGTTDARSGVALITVMLVFIVMSSIIVAMLSRQRLDVQRTRNMLNQAQAFQYALGAEELARQVLAADAAAGSEADHSGQDWASLREGVPLAQGSLVFFLDDLQGRFNLNTLISRTDEPMTRFRQLEKVLGIEHDLLPAILARVGSPQTPRPLASVQSLRDLEGMTPEIYATLSPYVVALPQEEPRLNVNTAPLPVLKAYIPQESDLKNFLKKREKKGFLTRDDLASLGITTTGMTVQSQFFRLNAQAEVQNSRVSLTSIIYREIDATGAVSQRIISRDMSKNF